MAIDSVDAKRMTLMLRAVQMVSNADNLHQSSIRCHAVWPVRHIPRERPVEKIEKNKLKSFNWCIARAYWRSLESRGQCTQCTMYAIHRFRIIVHTTVDRIPTSCERPTQKRFFSMRRCDQLNKSSPTDQIGTSFLSAVIRAYYLVLKRSPIHCRKHLNHVINAMTSDANGQQQMCRTKYAITIHVSCEICKWIWPASPQCPMGMHNAFYLLIWKLCNANGADTAAHRCCVCNGAVHGGLVVNGK